jgi:hypothetical protein
VFGEQIAIDFLVPVFEEDGFAPVTALRYVVRQVWNDDAGETGHVRSRCTARDGLQSCDPFDRAGCCPTPSPICLPATDRDNVLHVTGFSATVRLPPKDLFLQFQEKAHFVYVTGDRDTARFAWDFASMHSLRDWCVFNVEYQTNNFTDHEVMSPEALSRALDSLATPIEADAGRLAKCRAGIDAELESKPDKPAVKP